MWSTMKAVRRCLLALALLGALSSPALAADSVRLNGSGNGLHLMQPLIDAYSKAHAEVSFEVDKPLGSSGAIKALLAGAMDIVITSRDLKPAEIKAGARQTRYGQTPLALVTNKDVSKKDLSTQEFIDILAGKTLTWPGGAPIRLILRPVEDSDTKVLYKLSPAMEAAMASAQSRPGMTIAVTDPEALEAVVKTPGALGVAGLTGIVVAKPDLHTLTLDGVAPNPGTLASGQFPLAKELDIVTKEAALPEAARHFLAFVFSPEGRRIAEEAGAQITAEAKSPW